MKGRKIVICSRCSKEKIHFGLGMCSACLRRTKRETKPSFYLGTCYSEMSRRVKTYDPLRPNYFGKVKCTKAEFFNKFINDKDFLVLYSNWQKSGFKRKESPSIDRIDNELDYTLDNIRFIQHNENSIRNKRRKLTIKKYNDIIEFDTLTKCAKFLKASRKTIRKYINKEYTGWKIYES